MIIELRLGAGVVDIALGIVLPFVRALGSADRLAHQTRAGGRKRAQASERGLTRGGHALELVAGHLGKIAHAGLGAESGAYLLAIAPRVQTTASAIAWCTAALKASTTEETEFCWAGASAETVRWPTICFSGKRTS